MAARAKVPGFFEKRDLLHGAQPDPGAQSAAAGAFVDEGIFEAALEL